GNDQCNRIEPLRRLLLRRSAGHGGGHRDGGFGRNSYWPERLGLPAFEAIGDLSYRPSFGGFRAQAVFDDLAEWLRDSFEQQGWFVLMQIKTGQALRQRLYQHHSQLPNISR